MIDTHSHLFGEEFAADFPQTIQRAKEAGVTHIFMPNIDDESVNDLLQACEKYPGYCFPMIGYHPTSVDKNSVEKVKKMKSLLVEGHPYIGIGEVGMDLYWDKTYLCEQQQVLDEQIQWALEWDLPLIIHCREAFPQLFEVLRPYRDTPLRGIFHSFTGTVEEMNEVLTYSDFMVGINGVVTFKKSTLPQILSSVPLERIVLETDSPYLAPVPYRGKRNETSYLKFIAEKLSEIYEVDVHEIDRKTSQNTLKVFKKLGTSL